MDSATLLVCGDDSFGPSVKSADCRGGFDFTVLFEESILIILPAVCFILLTPFRAWRLLRRKIRVRRNALYVYKLTSIGVYIGLQLAILVISSTDPRVRTNISLASAVLTLISGMSLGLLSHLEHAKSIRPSFLINFYLIVTVFFDIARVRTQWLARSDDAVAAALTASLVVKCIMLLLEAVEKRSLLLGLDKHFSLESTSGLINRGSFWWLNSLLATGFKNVLSLDDLPAIHEKLDSERLASQLQTVWDKCDQKKRHALAYACSWSLRWEIIAIVVPKFCNVALSISQAYLIQDAVKFVQGVGTYSENYGYGLIGAFALVYLGLAFTTGWASHLTFRLMTMTRGQLIGIIYTKILTLPITDANESAALTLMGTDVQRIAETFHYLLIETVPSIVQLGIAVYILYTQLGAACIAPILVALISTGLSTLLAKGITARQKQWFEGTQKRINYTSEILGSMRNVKMLGLTQQMTNNMHQLREDEMKTSVKYRKFQALNVALMNLPDIFSRFFTFAAYAIVAKVRGNGTLSVSQAITSLAALQLLITPLFSLLAAIPTGWASLGCFERIQKFLLGGSRTERRLVRSGMSNQHDGASKTDSMSHAARRTTISVEGGHFGWSDSRSNILKDVNTAIKPEAKLTIVVGPVGCGKSTFLKGLLGETLKAEGLLFISSFQAAYCDQTPWIINGSIRDNVVAGSNYDETWYQTVIRACALDTDVRQLPDGDSTIVGSKGLKLSGGQKQRLSIARAVYSRKSLAILDDVLSGLDSVTEEHVFRRVFGREGLFQMLGTTVILATHSVKRLPQADLIIALSQTGEIVEQGTFDELNVPGNYVHSLQVKLEADTSHEEYDDGSFEDKRAPTGLFTNSKVADESRKTGDRTVYKYYSRSLGRWRLGLFLFLNAVNGTGNGLASTWINWWAQSSENGDNPRVGYWLGILSLLTSVEGMSMVAATAWLWIFVVPSSGTSLHRSLLDAAMRAPLSFFAETEIGVLVNRFSQDLRLADMTLPGTITNFSFPLSVTAVGYFAAVLPLVFTALYFIQRFYLRTSRQLRLLELEANAPLFSHFIESLSGLITIRSFGWTQPYTEKNRRLLDDSQKPYYLLLCVQRWLVLVLDLVIAGLAVVLVALAVSLRNRIDAGFLGLALVNMMGLNHALTNLIQAWTLLETSIGAIARIKDFSANTPFENKPGESDNAVASWPSRGALRFEDVSASYGKGEPVLKNLTFSIEPGQRIGVVGRTGSGKSSTTLALMRMIDIVSGRITLDDVDLATLQGSVVRERVICLTQDPFLFPGSVRSNVCPFSKSSDDDIAAALQKVGLWHVLQGKAATGKKEDSVSGVLDTVMDADFLSHGQRQLFCLARAILKKGRVLILDEPTSSVDAQTDVQMQAVIRSEFHDHTIIMIAHRISSLLDFDRIAVLDSGRLVEFGSPEELLKNSSGVFSKLYQGAGSKR